MLGEVEEHAVGELAAAYSDVSNHYKRDGLEREYYDSAAPAEQLNGEYDFD